MKSTTAFDDQFTPATQTILRTNVSESQKIIHDLQVRVKQLLTDYDVLANEYQATCAAHIATLDRLEEASKQKPVAWCDADGDFYSGEHYPNVWPSAVPLFAAPVPAPHKGTTHCDDCGLTWLDDGLNPLGCPYCKDAIPAPAVPAEIMALSKKYAIDTDAYHAAMDALLQSAEVRHD